MFPLIGYQFHPKYEYSVLNNVWISPPIQEAGTSDSMEVSLSLKKYCLDFTPRKEKKETNFLLKEEQIRHLCSLPLLKQGDVSHHFNSLFGPKVLSIFISNGEKNGKH